MIGRFLSVAADWLDGRWADDHLSLARPEHRTRRSGVLKIAAAWIAPWLVYNKAGTRDIMATPPSDPAQRPEDRKPTRTVGALVPADHLCPLRRMPVVAELGRHDRTMATEEARIGVRGVDGWLAYFSSRSS